MTASRDVDAGYARQSVLDGMACDPHEHVGDTAGADPVGLGDLELLAALHDYTGPAMTAGPLPEFGTARWAALADDDPAKGHAVVRAALAYWQLAQAAAQDHGQISGAVSAAVGPFTGNVAHTEIVRRRAEVHTAIRAQTAAQIKAAAEFSWRRLTHQHTHQATHAAAAGEATAGKGAAGKSRRAA